MRSAFVPLLFAVSAGAADPPTAPVVAQWGLPAAAGKATALAWLPDQTAIVAGDASGTVRVWDIATAREVAARTLGKAPVLDLDVSRDGKLVAAAAVRGRHGVGPDGGLGSNRGVHRALSERKPARFAV